MSPRIIRCQNAEYNPFANPEDSKDAPLVDNDDLDIVRVYDPDTTSTSTYPVGSPSTNLSVSPLGAAVYTVSIDVPKGVASLQPSVSLYDGAIAVETYARKWGAFTLGNYIMGDRGLQASPYNPTFQHESGHTITFN